MDNKIIVFSANDFFSIHACALLRSIEKNANLHNVEIHILSDGIRLSNKFALQQAVKLNIQFHELTKDFFSKNPLPEKITYLPRSAYFRLFIPELFPDKDKILYIDVDTIVMSDLNEIFEIAFDGKLCLACHDYGLSETRKKVNKFKNDPDSPYFNSGLMMIDLKKWREQKIKSKSYELLENEMRDPVFADQEVLNVVLENDWKSIDAKWNYPPHVSDYQNPPNIIHFMGYKPIYKDYKDRHKDNFYELLKGTKWENTEYGLIKKAFQKGPYKLKTLLIHLFSK